jgi:hypothetical protein
MHFKISDLGGQVVCIGHPEIVRFLAAGLSEQHIALLFVVLIAALALLAISFDVPIARWTIPDDEGILNVGSLVLCMHTVGFYGARATPDCS